MPEALQAFLNWITTGQTASAYTELVADNGMVIGDVIADTIIGGNGAATEAAQLVAVDGASATTAGAGIMAVELPAAAAAIAPALGLVAGVGLYNLAPEFWDSVAEDLIDAGQTIGGKVVGFVNADGDTAFSESTIEIIKNKLLDAGAFAPVAEYPTYETTGTVTVTHIGSFSSVWNLAKSLMPGIERTTYKTPLANYLARHITGVFTIVCSTNSASVTTYEGVIMEIFAFDGLTVGNQIDLNQTRLAESFEIWGRRTASVTEWGYQYRTNQFPLRKVFQGIFAETGESSTRTNISTLNITEDTSHLQPDAIYPTDDTFPTTYPGWAPWDLPGDDAYPTSLGVPGVLQPDAQTGENTLEDQIDDLLDLLYHLAVDDNVIPDDEAIDTDIADPIDEPVEDVIPQEEDPIDPIPDPPIIGTVVDLPTLETTRADRMFTVYNPSDATINSLGGFLWTNSIMEQIKKLWQDPMDAIIAFHKVYAAPTVGSSANIVFGFIDSGIGAPVVTSQFTEVDCGSVSITEQLHNATDYSPFSKAMIYLPFIGIVDIDITDIMGSSINVKYKIDMYTGTCLAMIFCTRTKDMPNAQLLYTFSGNASQQLPLTGSSFAAAIGALLGLAGSGIAVASGGAGLAVGAVGAAHSLTQEMVHMQRSGGLSANAGIMGPRKPYIILERQNCQDANGYYSYYGYPANKTIYLSNCSGYVRVKYINLKTKATEAERDEIINLLKEGVII